MNITTRTKFQLDKLFALCRATPNYRALYACGSRSSAYEAARLLMDRLEQGEEACNSKVWLNNGSTIDITWPEWSASVLRDEFSVVAIDEAADTDLAAWIKTRERL